VKPDLEKETIFDTQRGTIEGRKKISKDAISKEAGLAEKVASVGLRESDN